MDLHIADVIRKQKLDLLGTKVFLLSCLIQFSCTIDHPEKSNVDKTDSILGKQAAQNSLLAGFDAFSKSNVANFFRYYSDQKVN